METAATGQGLVDFFSFTADRGLMNGNTAGSLRSACKEVLSAVDGDENWATIDLRSIDPDDYAQRFERLRLGRFKPASLSVYKSRFKNGVQMYLAYLDNPSGWRYMADRPAKDRKKAVGDAPQQRHHPGSLASPQPPGITMIDYPFPLRPGLMVTLNLPNDMTYREAERIGAHLKSLAYEAPKEITAISSASTMGHAS